MGYERGLAQVADGAWAWLQPDGGWGWSNAGLVVDGDASLLVDTLFDERLTAEMLAAMRASVPAAARIGTVVNTHANGDHCYGNGLVRDAEIVASTASAKEMDEVPASLLAQLVGAGDALGPAGTFAARIFGAFDFAGVHTAPPTRTFDGRLDLAVGATTVELHELGPAHTGGDVVVHVPSRGVLFSGDLLFVGGHAVMWAGPLRRWVDALDRIVALDPAVVVPGHGPVTDVAGVRAERQRLEDLEGAIHACYAEGLDVLAAARRLHAADASGLHEAERYAVNVATEYRHLSGGEQGRLSTLELFGAMAELAGVG
jgi:glyoxylase-like metal-dependent hydrolase (beta-lactamase superfamily II)